MKYKNKAYNSLSSSSVDTITPTIWLIIHQISYPSSTYLSSFLVEHLCNAVHQNAVRVLSDILIILLNSDK